MTATRTISMEVEDAHPECKALHLWNVTIFRGVDDPRHNGTLSLAMLTARTALETLRKKGKEAGMTPKQIQEIEDAMMTAFCKIRI